MNRPPSFPLYQNPNPNFINHCPPPPPPPTNPNPNFFFPRPPPPLQNPNTYSIPPSPPPIRDLSGTISSLQSLLSECQTTLASLSQNLDQSSLLHNGFVRCPFDPNHLMPPESLFLHSLRCPNQLNLTHLLEPFSTHRKTHELLCEPQVNHDGDGELCYDFSLAGVGTNFYYNDCPGAVNFSELNGKKKLTLRLPRVLSVQCSDFVSSDDNEERKCLLEILPSDFVAMRSEIDQWRDCPNSYSYSVLSSILSSNVIETSEFPTWILVNSTRYGVIIDSYMRDHILLLFRLCLRSAVKEACESYTNAVDEKETVSCKSRTFECPVLIQSLSWLASQLAVLYGDGNGKFFALDMFKQCIVESASRIMLFRSERTKPESSKALDDLDEEENSLEKTRDSAQVISVSCVAAAVAALYERSVLEEKIRAIRYPQPLTRYQRAAELASMTAKADEERKGRPSYRPIIDHDGLPRQRSSNQDMNKMKTREELLAEERDYKRRRMSYRGKKVKRTPREVLRDMIEEFTEEVKLAGGIGCFEKGMPVAHSLSSIGNNQKESDFGYNTVSTTLRDAIARKREKDSDEKYAKDTDKGKRYEDRSQRQGSYKDGDHRRDDEFTRTKRYSPVRKTHRQNHKSSREKSYKVRRDDDRYNRRSRESRNHTSFEDRYNPTLRE